MPTNTSDKQLAANRANAALSTGPRTATGKTRSAQNARKHGFTGSSFAVIRLEDLQDVAHLKDDLLSVYRPVNSQEVFALERVALAQQALLRAARLESGLFTSCLDFALDRNEHPMIPMSPDLAGDGDIEITRAQNRNFALATGFHRIAKQSNAWSLFLRYQAQAERHYRRAIEEFERLQALPAPPEGDPPIDLPNEPISDTQPEETTAASLPETNPLQPVIASDLAPDPASEHLPA